MARTAVVEGPFRSFEQRLGAMKDYMYAMMPGVRQQPAALSVFVHSCVVLTTAQYGEFLRALVGTAAGHREEALRRHVVKTAPPERRLEVKHLDRVSLVREAKNRLSFKNGGRRIAALFQATFGCVPWPSDEVRDLLSDLVVIRNMIVHEGSGEVGIGHVGLYAGQLRRADVFNVSRYDDWSVNHLDPMKTLRFFTQAVGAIATSFHHLEERLVTNDEWLDRP
jgi:hypothetical protein